jgi:hypothetical protein
MLGISALTDFQVGDHKVDFVLEIFRFTKPTFFMIPEDWAGSKNETFFEAIK